jgi:hypothetical protein
MHLTIPHGLGQKVNHPEPYTSRYAPVSLAMFRAVVREERSFDDYFSGTNPQVSLLSLIHASAPASRRPSSPHSSRGPMVPDTVSHTSLLPIHLPFSPSSSTHSLPPEGPIAHHPLSHSLRTLSEAVTHPSLHPSRLPASVQNHSAKGGPTPLPLRTHGPTSPIRLGYLVLEPGFPHPCHEFEYFRHRLDMTNSTTPGPCLGPIFPRLDP